MEGLNRDPDDTNQTVGVLEETSMGRLTWGWINWWGLRRVWKGGVGRRGLRKSYGWNPTGEEYGTIDGKSRSDL